MPGLQQVNVILPELEATGLLPVEIRWLGRRISPPATLRVIPPGPSVPRIRMITDGVNLVADHRIETRLRENDRSKRSRGRTKSSARSTGCP